MERRVGYTKQERFWLISPAAFGFLAVNGAFAYGLFFQPEAMAEALANPLAAAFIVEALLVTGVFAYLLLRWGDLNAVDYDRLPPRLCRGSYLLGNAD